jgi:nitrogen fixation NifU-like protein
VSATTTAPLAAMYQDVILAHYRAPHNKRAVEGPSGVGARRNPLCGDEVRVEVRVEDGVVRDVAFGGRCCSIAQASASMLTDAVRGGTREEVEARWQEVDALLHGRDPGVPDGALGDRAALRGVAAFAARVPCALLPWQALRDALVAAESR